jgi:hypothetical protein
MIVSVGGTPAPIIKPICEYEPEFISFFATQETCDLVKGIKDDVLNGLWRHIRKRHVESCFSKQ